MAQPHNPRSTAYNETQASPRSPRSPPPATGPAEQPALEMFELPPGSAEIMLPPGSTYIGYRAFYDDGQGVTLVRSQVRQRQLWHPFLGDHLYYLQYFAAHPTRATWLLCSTFT